MDSPEIKTQEELLRSFEDTKKQLLQLLRWAELGMMAASVIHGLRQPLAGIKSMAQLILEDLQEDSPIRSKVELILKQSVVMEEIVERILEFSRQTKRD